MAELRRGKTSRKVDRSTKLEPNEKRTKSRRPMLDTSRVDLKTDAAANEEAWLQLLEALQKETSRERVTARPGKESHWEETLRSGNYFQAERGPHFQIYTIRHRRAVAGMRYSARRKLWEKQTASTASKQTWRRLKAEIAAGRHQCSYCWRTAEGIDHIIPLSRGGTHREGNWTPACNTCNRAKGKMFLIEWRQKRLGEGVEDDEED